MKDKMHDFKSDLLFNWFGDINKVLKKDHNIIMRHVLFVVFWIRLKFVAMINHSEAIQ